MGTMNNILKNLNNQYNVNMLYRYQGNDIEGSSLKHLVIDKTKPRVEMKIKGNVYFSKSYDHHKYFVRKRLKQEVNKFLTDEKLPTITQSNMRLLEHYNEIKHSIIRNYYYFNNESIRLTVPEKLLTLIKENSMKQEEKPKYLNIPELSDRRKYGGAYGIPNEWLELLNNLTLFYSKIEIDYDDVLNYLYKVRLNYISTHKSDVTDFLELKKPSTYINEKIYSPYHKYIVLDNMEKIMEQKAYIKASDLGRHPTKTIKEIIEEYKILREFILNNVEKEYEQKILRLK